MRSSDWHVYIIECADTTLYTGIALDPIERLEKHNAGSASKYTRSRRPVRLVYCERVDGKSAALKREIQIKALSRTAKGELIAASSQ